MTDELLKTMQTDISRCEEAQDSIEGSFELYQALIGKYSTRFPYFEKEIPQKGKTTAIGSPYDYRSELNAVKEKLQFVITCEAENDPLFEFKRMFTQDLNNLLSAKHDTSNRETPELAKQQLYKEITAKYHAFIPKLGYGLYQYSYEHEFYDDVSGDSLFHNLNQLYNKMLAYKAIGYPGAVTCPVPPQTQIINNNANSANANAIASISIDQTIDAINALPQDILTANEKEKIEDDMRVLDSLKFSGKKEKFWNRAKPLLVFLADKSVDAMIAAAPYIINTLKQMS